MLVKVDCGTNVALDALIETGAPLVALNAPRPRQVACRRVLLDARSAEALIVNKYFKIFPEAVGQIHHPAHDFMHSYCYLRGFSR